MKKIGTTMSLLIIILLFLNVAAAENGAPALTIAPALSNENILLDDGLKIFTSDNYEQSILNDNAVLSFDICVFRRSVTVMDVLFLTDSLNFLIENAELVIAKYEYDPDVPSYEMEPRLVGAYPAAGRVTPESSPFWNEKCPYMIYATGLNHSLETGTYRVSLILKGDLIQVLNPKTLYALGITGAGGSIQLITSYLDVITLGSSLRLSPEETLKVYTEAYDEQFAAETDVKEQQRATATIGFEKPIVLSVNGSPVRTDSPPVIEQDRTLAPVRALVEALGYIVAWEPVSQEVEIYETKTYNCVLSMTVDSNIAYILTNTDGISEMEELQIDVPVKIINGRTMAPVRFIAEALGFTVNWNDSLNIVLVTTD